MLDPELQDLVDKSKAALAETSTLKGAVSQLERQMAALPTTIEDRLRAVKMSSWDARGNYRGIFQTEEDATCMGAFILAHTAHDTRAADRLSGELRGVYERALGGTQATGDGLVPIEFSSRIQRLIEATGVWPRLAFPMPMTSDQLTFQKRTSGVTVFKTGTNVAATASDMGFSTINLNADEWNSLSLYPKALGEDSAADVGELVSMEIATAFSQQLDQSGLVGDGTLTDLDIQGITTRLININGVDDGGGLVLGFGNLWSELVEDDFNKMVGTLPNYAGANPVWICSAPFFFTVMNAITLGKGGVTRSDFAGRQSLQFLGYPVELSSKMPKAQGNSQIPVIFGDLRLSSTHGRRRDLFIEEDRSVKFIERQVAVLGTQRHAVNNHSLGDATNAGPVVGLITAAS